MAETFLAVQQGAAGFEQRVCIKFILPAYRNDPSFRQLFLREATIAASLRHANIVGVIDVDPHAGYIVLELVDGVDLRTLLDAAPNRRLPAAVVSLIAIEMCKALAYAHGRTRRGEPDGIVHRDISPSNVLVAHTGEVKLTDFGVAKAMRSSGEPASTTIKGKLCYMSPEQTRGEHLDGRSDLFSLGVMLYELLSSKRPFDGPTDAQTLLRIEAGQHPSLVELAPDVPGGLALVVERMLRRNPEHRYPSADACIDALARFAPPITTYRELGQLARAARAPETLSTNDFAITPVSGPRKLIDPLDATRPSLQGLERADRYPYSTLPQPVPLALPSSTPFSVRDAQPWPSARVSRKAWLALAGSMLLAVSVLVGWISRLGDAADSGPLHVLELGPAAASEPKSPAEPKSPVPAAESEPATSPTATVEPSVAPILPPPRVDPAPDQPSPARPGSPDPASEPRASGPRPTAQPATRPPAAPLEEASATLRVGTLPLGQVWIDGQASGWAPVLVKLTPGIHSIAGGNTSPEVTRSVRLRAGETRQLVLNLEDEAADEAQELTHQPNRR